MRLAEPYQAPLTSREQVSVFLLSFSRADKLESNMANARSANVLSDNVNAHLGQCYLGQARNALSKLDTQLWVPFVEQLKNDVRLVLAFRSGGKSPQLDAALAKLTATARHSNTREPTGSLQPHI